MPKTRKKRKLKRVSALPDLEQWKAAVLSSLNIQQRSTYLRSRHYRLRGLVLLRAATRIQPHRRVAIPDLSRTEAVRADYNQPAPGRRPACGVSGLTKSCGPAVVSKQAPQPVLTEDPPASGLRRTFRWEQNHISLPLMRTLALEQLRNRTPDIRTLGASCYPWHPWHGRTVWVRAELVRHGQAVAYCSLEDVQTCRVLEVPLWMLELATCSRTRISEAGGLRAFSRCANLRRLSLSQI